MAARALAIVLLGAALPPTKAHAAAARRLTVPPGQAAAFLAWDRYLSAGPQLWSRTHAPSFTPAVRGAIWDIVQTNDQAQALANPMIDYLLWRRSLNPARFTAHHPRLSPALEQLLTPSPIPVNVPPPTYIPVPRTTATSPQTVAPPITSPPAPLAPPSPQNVEPPSVPEPSSLLLAAGMLAWGLWWRRRMSGRLASG